MTTNVEVTHRLFPQQMAFFLDQSPYAAAVTGVGGGKSYCGALKMFQYMRSHPKSVGMVTAVSYPMLRDATLKSIQQVFPEGSYVLNIGDMTLKYQNGAEALLRSTDEPSRLRGPNLAWVWMDEAARSEEEAFLVLQGRLRQTGFPHQMWLTTTPNGFNWVYKLFKQFPKDGYALHQWRTMDNPNLPPLFIKNLLESYQGEFALQELEGQFVALSGSPFFDGERLREMLDDCRAPYRRELGAISVWRLPVVAGRYVAGGDLAWGETGAYSCLEVLDYQTGEQMAELHGRLPSDEMAKMAVDLCKRYNNAYAVMEANGEGINVVTKMVELGYGARMHHRDADPSQEGLFRRMPKRPGWQTTPATRPVMLGDLAQAVRDRGVIVHSREAMGELLSFVRDEKGKPGPVQGQYSDRVMALGLALQGKKYGTFSATADPRFPQPLIVRRW